MADRAPLPADPATRLTDWHKAVAPSAHYDRGAKHARFLNDPAAVAASNRAHLRGLVMRFVESTGHTVSASAVDQFVAALLADTD
ncbi:MAG: hypothetical protein U1E37_02740 [Sphingomonadaceae bacterium]